ncbi:MAG: hypothetical protein HY023_19340, partial [Chloroflexi bacterium]|nr:hypothetical protein [Chloroflexota bacterium]
TLIAFVGGTTLTDPQRILVAVVGIGLALVGTIFALRSQFAIRNSQLLNLQLRRGALHSPISDLQPLTSILLFAWLPPLLLGLLSLWRPAFDERFLTGTIPPVLILIALPIVHWWPDRRWLSAIGVVALILVAGLSLTNYFFNPAFGKSPNWRGIAAYLSTHTSAAELVLQDFQDPAFGYYYQGPAQPVDAPVAPGAATEEQLAAWLDTHPRLWLFVADSTASDGDWLNDHAERLMDEWIFGFRLQAFDSPAGSLAAMIPFERNFSDGIRLIGYRLLPSTIGRGIRGEGLHLTLYWQSIAAASKDYTVFTHVLTTDGVQVAGQDNPPARGRRPTSRWQTGETIVDPYDLTLSADLAPGAYSIQVGLYDPATGARLSVVDSQTDSVTLPEPIELKDAIRDSQFSIRQLE